jgi:hypothetical protein
MQPPLRRRGARRRQAEPHPQRDRARRRARRDADPRVLRRGGPLSRASEAFGSSPSHAYPELRRAKALRLSASPFLRGAGQSAVWDEVHGKAARLRVDWPTGAQRDIFAAREDALGKLRLPFPLAPGQTGALFALGDRLCVDYVSRPDAFARLYPKLLDGYLLDASEQRDIGPPSVERLAGFLAAAGASVSKRAPSASLGDDLRLVGDGLVGSGLTVGASSCSSPYSPPTSSAPHGRVGRTSRRR